MNNNNNNYFIVNINYTLTIFSTRTIIYLVSLVIIILIRITWLGRVFGIKLLRFLYLYYSTYSGV